MGDPVAGGSVYWLTDSVDAGPIAAQEHVFVAPGDTPERLWRDKLAPLGVKLTLKALEDLAAGWIVARRQDEACATWEPSWERPPLTRPDLDLIGLLPEDFRLEGRA